MRPYTTATSSSSSANPPAPAARARGASVGSNTGSSSRLGGPHYIPIPAPPSAAALAASNSSSRRSPGTPTSPPAGAGPQPSPSSPRNSFLPSFMTRNRPRASTLSRQQQQQQQQSPSRAVQQQPAMNTSSSTSSGRTGTPPSLARSVSTPAPFNAGNAAADASSRRSDGGLLANTTTGDEPAVATHRIRLVPHLETYRSLHFEPVVRDCWPSLGPEYEAAMAESEGAGGAAHGTILKVGRFTEKAQAALERHQQAARAHVEGATQALMAASLADHAEGGEAALAVDGGQETMLPSMRYSPTSRPPAGAGGGGSNGSTKVAFKSKVVSRSHAEIWCEEGGKFFIRDTKSSSGTFLNHIRLSNPNQESRPFPIKDGDVIQLGVDYQGGTEEMYRCIKIKVEIGRERRREQSNYNKEAMKQLQALGGVPDSPTAAAASSSAAAVSSSSPTAAKKEKQKAGVCDCCICLFAVTVSQALFIAPCSHAFHYKCIRPMLQMHHPGFACPLCRSFHNLEADVELDDWEIASRRHSTVSRRESSVHLPQAAAGDDVVPPVPPLPVAIGASQAMASGEHVVGNDVERQVTRVPIGDAGDELDPSDLVDEGDHEPAAAASTSSSSGGPPAPSSSSRNHGLSLGSLPIPSMSRGGPPTANDLDAATPMNNTFLSTLAETMGAMSFSGAGGAAALPTHAEEEGEAAAAAAAASPVRGTSDVGDKPQQPQQQLAGGIRTTHSGRPYGVIESGEAAPSTSSSSENTPHVRTGDDDDDSPDVEAAAAEQQEKMARRDMMYT